MSDRSALQTPLPVSTTPGLGSATSSDGREPVVQAERLSKHFRREDGRLVRAIDQTSLTVGAGEFLVLLGPSGCGKTTLLRVLAGLERPDDGELRVCGDTVYSARAGRFIPPERRRLSMMFQSYALWPHMTAFKNVAYPLQGRHRKMSRSELRDRVASALRSMQIGDIAEQYPHQMSGGQQQRVALARALVSGSSLILFDEPLSNVDAQVRERLRVEMVATQKEIGFAAVYVTHDQNEAMQLADRIAVLRNGRIAQIGSSHDLYLRPNSRYVANFIGASSEFEGRATRVDGNAVTVSTEFGEVKGEANNDPITVDAPVVALWRPETCELRDLPAGAKPADKANTWLGIVEFSVFVGSHVEHVVRLGNNLVRHWSSRRHQYPAGTTVSIGVAPSDVQVFPVGQD